MFIDYSYLQIRYTALFSKDKVCIFDTYYN